MSERTAARAASGVSNCMGGSILVAPRPSISGTEKAQRCVAALDQHPQDLAQTRNVGSGESNQEAGLVLTCLLDERSCKRPAFFCLIDNGLALIVRAVRSSYKFRVQHSLDGFCEC